MSSLLTLFGDLHNCCTGTGLPTNAETVPRTHHINLVNNILPPWVPEPETTKHRLIADMVESQWQLERAGVTD